MDLDVGEVEIRHARDPEPDIGRRRARQLRRPGGELGALPRDFFPVYAIGADLRDERYGAFPAAVRPILDVDTMDRLRPAQIEFDPGAIFLEGVEHDVG